MSKPQRTVRMIYPDRSEVEITSTPKLIGRADLAIFLSDPFDVAQISKGHITVYEETDRCYVEDGKTAVQNKPSANHTWLIRGSSEEDITGRGKRELMDGDKIDIAHKVKLRVYVK